jgi:hypothetical protein
MSHADWSGERDDSVAGTDESGDIEPINDAGCHIRKLNERSEKRAAIYAQTRLIESYINGDLYVGLRCVSGDFRNYGFVFQPEHIGRGQRRRGDLSSECGRETWMHDCGNEPFMFTQNVELMECPQESITSIVRTERFDDCSFGGGKPLFAFESIEWIDHVLERSEDWKVRIVTRRYAVSLGQSAGEEIKRAAKGANDCSDFSINNSREWLFCARYHCLPVQARIKICDDGLDIHMLPGICAPSEDWELGFAPIDTG